MRGFLLFYTSLLSHSYWILGPKLLLIHEYFITPNYTLLFVCPFFNVLSFYFLVFLQTELKMYMLPNVSIEYTLPYFQAKLFYNFKVRLFIWNFELYFLSPFFMEKQGSLPTAAKSHSDICNVLKLGMTSISVFTILGLSKTQWNSPVLSTITFIILL